LTRQFSAKLQKVAALLAQGGLLIYPTETFYALGADSDNPQALKRLLALKQRSWQHTLPLIGADCRQIAPLLESKFVPELYESIAAKFWPGPLTLILPARPHIAPALLSPPTQEGGCRGVAVRLSPHPIASGLAACLGRPIVATSANVSGKAAVADPGELEQSLLRGVDFFWDDGPCSGGLASTILDLRSGPPFKIIRPGAVLLPPAWVQPAPRPSLAQIENSSG
jgi:L-threonylcarbamoyladenylate synthase